MNRQTEYILTEYITDAQKKELVEYLSDPIREQGCYACKKCLSYDARTEIIDNLLLMIAKYRARNIWIKPEHRENKKEKNNVQEEKQSSSRMHCKKDGTF